LAADGQCIRWYVSRIPLVSTLVTFFQAMITRGLSEKPISSVPRVIGPPALLEPEEKYAWDPSSLVSPIYNPTDGGHQTTSTNEPNTQRTSRSPLVGVASQSGTSEHREFTTLYSSYLPKPLRPVYHGLPTGEPNLHLKQAIWIAHSFSNVPGLFFYDSDNVSTSWAGEGWESVRYPPTVVATSLSRSSFGQKSTLSNPPLENEWNRLMQQGPYTPP
jgi:hypothetical protein